MMYLVRNVYEDMQDWAWRELREANDWLYACYLEFGSNNYTESHIETMVDNARWHRKIAVQRAVVWQVPCEDHIFQKNERGHSICRKCHYFSILESSL